jgi:hypothetical protein
MKVLLYNFSGELDDISHLFPNERLAQIAAILLSRGAQVVIRDRGNVRTLTALAPPRWKQRIASAAGRPIFRRLAANRPLSALDRIVSAPALALSTSSMARQQDRLFASFMAEEADRIAGERYDIVFLNLWQGAFAENMLLADRLKRIAPTPIYAIGQRVDWFQEHIIRHYAQVDGIVLGLAYDTFGALAGGAPITDLPNVAYRSPSGDVIANRRTVPDISNLPHPSYDPRVYEDIDRLFPLYHVSLSNQACPNACAFCPRPSNYGHTVREKPISAVVDELRALCDSGVRHFRIADSTPPEGLLTRLADALIDARSRFPAIHLSAFSRVDTNRVEDFHHLREAGFEALFFGLESLDDASLVRMGKGITYEQIRETLRRAHAADIFVVGSLIYPLPGETAASRANTITRLREIAPSLDSLLVQPAGVYPSSRWAEDPASFGIHLPQDYIRRGLHYPVKLIVPMRFWPEFPFTYDLMGTPAVRVTFADILREFESFSREVWQHLGIGNIQDYTLLVAGMVGREPLSLTNQLKEMMVTRDYAAVDALLAAVHRSTPPQES